MSETDSQQHSISEAGAKQLLKQCVQLGLFHDSSRRHSKSSDDDDLETFRKLQKDPLPTFSFDVNCHLINSNGSDYYTQEGLVRAMVEELDEQGGRLSRQHLCERLQVDAQFLGDDSPLLQMLPTSVQVLGTNVLSEKFWLELRESTARQVKEYGSLDILKLANQCLIPMEVFLAQVVSKMDQAHWIDGSNILASDNYIGQVRSSVIDCFKSLTEPALISKVCEEHSWDVVLALDWLIQECKNANLPGEVHVDAAGKNTSTAMYLPEVYTSSQQKEVMKFLSDNGFISQDRATRHGLSISKVANLAKGTHDDILIMSDLVMVGHIVLQKIQSAIQVCMASGVVDILDHLSTELIRSDILRELLCQAEFSLEQGILILSDGRAILIAKTFVEDVTSRVLSPLVQTFAKARAAEILVSTTPGASASTEIHNDHEEPSATGRSGKGKSKSRKGKVKRTNHNHVEVVGVVPLLKVAQTVLDQFPNTPMTEIDKQDLAALVDGVSWDDEEDCGVLLVEFCKTALYTDRFRSQCENATEAELDCLKSAKQSKATLSRKDEASKVRSVATAFEEGFVALCYLVQANAKFLALAENSNSFDEASLQVLRSEMLQCSCADFTSRINQYCLFQNEEEAVFTFMKAEEQEVEANDAVSALPPFCNTVDVAARRYRRSYLSCPPPREPLPVLRESLPGNLGVTLARQWVLCGGESYRGGVRKSEEDGSMFVRPGSIDGFLSHVQENCLSLCGLPFKNLDKKSEKQFLFKRRQTLAGLLQAATEATAILELTIMILFQQVRNMVVSGDLLRGAIFKMLRDERKISDEVAAVLEGLNSAIAGGASIKEDLVNAVKECGLCRDIAKHEVDFKV
jgi:hypothetical protein